MVGLGESVVGDVAVADADVGAVLVPVVSARASVLLPSLLLLLLLQQGADRLRRLGAAVSVLGLLCAHA